MRILSLLLLGALSWAAAQTNLAPRVLVIHNTASPWAADSLDVATHYTSLRPGAQTCGVAFPDADAITETQWLTSVRGAIRNCLDQAVGGRQGILYVVLSYQTPYRIVRSATERVALDSYVADIWDAVSTQRFNGPVAAHRYFSQPQTQGNVYDPFLTLAAFRSQGRIQLVYSVWRLDGPSAAAAKGMVTRAVAVENAGGLTPASGTMYFDRRLGDINQYSDSSVAAGEQDLYRAASQARTAGFTVVDDDSASEIGFAPAPLSAPNAIFYSGWYQIFTYNDVFTWQPGAIGWHLDSASSYNLRTAGTPAPGSPAVTGAWVPNAIARGITVTAGSTDEPYLEGLPHPDTVFRHLAQGGNAGDAFLRGTAWVKWMILNLGDPLYRPFPNGLAPFNNPAYREDTLVARPTILLGGSPSLLTVTLKDPAPSGGVTVNWSNTWATYFGDVTPRTSVIPAGQRTATTTLNTYPQPEGYLDIVVTANTGATTLRNTVTLASWIDSLRTTTPSPKGGTGGRISIYLNTPAPAGGFTVALTSSLPGVVQVPASLTLPAGTTVAAFDFTTSAVGAATNVIVTATGAPYLAKLTLSVQP